MKKEKTMGQEKSRFIPENQIDPDKQITIRIDGRSVSVSSGITVAAALLGNEDTHFCRSAAEGDKRAPYCLMGVCFECLVEIDGIRNRQACLEPVYEGMRVKRQLNATDKNENEI